MEKQKALIHRTLKSQRREKSLRNYQRVKRRKTGKRAIQTKTLEKRARLAPKNRNSRKTQDPEGAENGNENGRGQLKINVNPTLTN